MTASGGKLCEAHVAQFGCAGFLVAKAEAAFKFRVELREKLGGVATPSFSRTSWKLRDRGLPSASAQLRVALPATIT
jgi:hypothetical protein